MVQKPKYVQNSNITLRRNLIIMNKLNYSLYPIGIKFFRAITNIHSKSLNLGKFKIIPAIGMVSFFLRKDANKPSITAIIQNADNLFNDEKYVDVYNLLLQFKEETNVEILWRISRVLFKMIQLGKYGAESNRSILLQEAFDLISKSLEIDKEHAEVQKWMAILLDEKLQSENTVKKISETAKIINHLMKAHDLNPNDYTVLFLLGSWYYNINKLTWFQKKLATLMFKDLPCFSSENALHYFLKAEEVKPKYCVSNMYMLGKINHEMGNLYRAHYYLTIASQMYPANDREIQYITSAQKLVETLKFYDVSEEAL